MHYNAGVPHLGTVLPVPLPLQNCCPGLLFDFQVGLQTELPAAPWRGSPVPTTRARVNRALSVWAGAWRAGHCLFTQSCAPA